MDYKEYNDFELLNYIAEKNEEATNIMYKKYEPLIANISRKMIKYVNGSGLEINDLIQEGMLGLSSAIDSYDSVKDASFYTYAKTCIERKIISLIVSTTRLKRKVLNESISIEATDENGEKINLDYLFIDEKENPVNKLLSDEYEQELYEIVKNVFTGFEQQVFELKINGFDYKEIAEILDKDAKSIDNALQRIKSKLKKELQKEEF